MAFLQLHGISKHFEGVRVLDDIHIAINQGEFLVLVGPSGCGKSTLLNCIAGLEEPSSGRVLIGDQDITNVAPSQRDIAMVFQSYALYPNMTAAKNITFALEMRGVGKPAREQACSEVAELLQIGHLLDRKPGQLSGGQRQRVAMGRALVRHPQVFLFDEPLSNLDAKLRVDMRTEIKRLHTRINATIVYVTHDQIEAMTLADTIAVMKGGIVQQLASPAEIYNRPANVFVATFMGSPAMNLISVTISKGKAVLEIEGKKVAMAVPDAPLSDGQVLMGIRPEHITDTQTVTGGSNTTHTLQLPVEVVEPAGSDTFVVTKIGTTSLIARMRGDIQPVVGTTVDFCFHLNKAVFFDPHTEQRI